MLQTVNNTPHHEEICEYNGQRVLVADNTDEPITFHDCGNPDCPLMYTEQRIHKAADHTHSGRPLDFDSPDWEGACEWFDEYGSE